MKRRIVPGLLTFAISTMLSWSPALASDACGSAESASTTGSVARPAVVRGNRWFLRNSLTTGSAETSFVYGSPGDVPFFGDWDGDGIDTPGVVRGNRWYLRNDRSTGVADVVLTFGDIGDIPVVGDWNGDGVDTVGVVRGNAWFLRNENSTGQGEIEFAFGSVGDKPIVGDWDGDGDFTPGVTRAGHCFECPDSWWIRDDNSTGNATEVFENQGAVKPVPADWLGQGRTSPGAVENAMWFVSSNRSDGLPTQFTFGEPDDVPLAWGD